MQRVARVVTIIAIVLIALGFLVGLALLSSANGALQEIAGLVLGLFLSVTGTCLAVCCYILARLPRSG